MQKGGEQHECHGMQGGNYENHGFTPKEHSTTMLEYPLESVSGNGEGICLPEWYYPNKNLLSGEKITVLEEL